MAKVILSSTTEVVLSALCGGGGAEPMQAVECGEHEKPAQFTRVPEIILDDWRKKLEAATGIFLH